MFKHIIFFSFLSFSIQAMEKHQSIEFSGRSVLASSILGNIRVRYNGINYSVINNEKEVQVPMYSVDALLRKMKPEHLKKFITCGYIKVKRFEDGCYALESRIRGEGGGILGANVGFWTGKFITHLVAQTGIAIATTGVAIVCPPAATPFFYAAQATIAPAVEAASNVVGLGIGIVGAATTGPV
ncbi:hypothetical protein KG892_01300 [Vermiphilus pyriformis]|uniref:Uncharacterized protein n=1 Tax=candidate division TM6 bacterium JCVI TM6SC1 TaxID=1306947 RepID=A0A0D2I3D5_9BACT|nr:hypothetical protein J120_01845 [candidate division TM6 bacterium JCVI TM6SC1]UNE35642.1 MAG: hypothetical protein KG892_01300 [Vermiphilus pyriformis]